MFECGDCDRSFRSERALQQHLSNSPAHATRFDCEECDRSFNSEAALQQHLDNSPARAPRFECEECDRAFNSERALQQHLADSPVHTSGTPIDRFFLSYSNFDYNRYTSPPNELRRLRGVYRWANGDPDGEDAWARYRKALVQEFQSWYGTDDNSLSSWHSLCRAIGIQPLPGSCEACREAVRGQHVNMIDLVDHQRIGRDTVRVFPDLESLRDYTVKTGRYFPKDSLEAGALLRNLLREILKS